MHPIHNHIRQSRRDFLTSTASGVGLVALASMLKQEGLLAADGDSASKITPFPAKAKACICIYLEGCAEPDRPVRPQAEIERS